MFAVFTSRAYYHRLGRRHQVVCRWRFKMMIQRKPCDWIWDAHSFHKPLHLCNVSYMQHTFRYAYLFKQDLEAWCVSSVGMMQSLSTLLFHCQSEFMERVTDLAFQTRLSSATTVSEERRVSPMKSGPSTLVPREGYDVNRKQQSSGFIGN